MKADAERDLIEFAGWWTKYIRYCSYSSKLWNVVCSLKSLHESILVVAPVRRTIRSWVVEPTVVFTDSLLLFDAAISSITVVVACENHITVY
jgi:hypothetical protein